MTVADVLVTMLLTAIVLTIIACLSFFVYGMYQLMRMK